MGCHRTALRPNRCTEKGLSERHIIWIGWCIGTGRQSDHCPVWHCWRLFQYLSHDHSHPYRRVDFMGPRGGARANPPYISYVAKSQSIYGYDWLVRYTGPFLGIWFSLIAIQNSRLGIAATLMALPPILLIPIEYIVYKRKVSLRGILGTLVAIAGVILILLLNGSDWYDAGKTLNPFLNLVRYQDR